MRKLTLLALILSLFISPVCARKKGRLSVGAKVSIYDPPGSASSALLFEVSAKYRISTKVAAELSVGWTKYKDDRVEITMIPIQLNGEFHPLGQNVFDPYLSAGIGGYLTQRDEKVDVTAGVQSALGLKFSPKGMFSFSVEIKYILPDITDPKSGGVNLGGGIQGRWETEL